MNNMKILLQFFESIVTALTNGKYWWVKVSVVAILLNVIQDMPFGTDFIVFNDLWYSQYFDDQAAEPFELHDGLEYMPEGQFEEWEGLVSHLNKRPLRLTVALLGHLLGLGNEIWLYTSVLSGLLIFPVFTLLAYKCFKDRILALIATLIYASAWVAGHGFEAFHFSDSVAWFLLLSAFLFRNPFLVFTFCLSASFVDERAFIATGALFVFHGLDKFIETKTIRSYFTGISLAICLSGLLYLILRFFLKIHFGLVTGNTDLFERLILYRHLKTLPFPAFKVFEALWFVFPVSTVFLLLKKHYLLGAMLILEMAALLLISIGVYDIDRSLGYLIVCLPICFYVINVSVAREKLLEYSNLILLFNLLFFVPYESVIRVFMILF